MELPQLNCCVYAYTLPDTVRARKGCSRPAPGLIWQSYGSELSGSELFLYLKAAPARP